MRKPQRGALRGAIALVAGMRWPQRWSQSHGR